MFIHIVSFDLVQFFPSYCKWSYVVVVVKVGAVIVAVVAAVMVT